MLLNSRSLKGQACPICGSPDRSCAGGHAGNSVHPVDIPDQAPRRFVGPMVVAWELRPDGTRYLIRIRRDEAETRGLELLDDPAGKARRPASARDKARRPASARDKVRP